MRRLRSVAGLLSLLVWASAGRAVERPAFPYDRARTPRYLTQTIATQSVGPATQLRAELSAVVAEILDGPWRPLYSDYSAGEAGGVGLAEWCFNRPGDYVRALSMAAPLLAADRQAQVHEFLRVLMQSCPPTQQVYLPDRPGKARNVRPTPPPRWPQLGDREAQCAQFAEAGAVEAYARAFDAWVEVKPLFEDLKRLRPQLEFPTSTGAVGADPPMEDPSSPLNKSSPSFAKNPETVLREHNSRHPTIKPFCSF